jgi:phosphoribosylanthranilate isomerase
MSDTTKIKICGITNAEDALLAAELGADALGFVFADSPRKVAPDVAAGIIAKLPPFITNVGVFVNHPIGDVKSIADFCNLDALQFHGDENITYCRSFRQKVIKAFRVRNYNEIEEWIAQENKYETASLSEPGANVVAFLVDAYAVGKYGGTGKRLKWEIVSDLELRKPLILAGGLDHKNVGLAIEAVKPYGVDVSSGIELKPGKKNKRKLREFIKVVRESE